MKNTLMKLFKIDKLFHVKIYLITMNMSYNITNWSTFNLPINLKNTQIRIIMNNINQLYDRLKVNNKLYENSC